MLLSSGFCPCWRPVLPPSEALSSKLAGAFRARLCDNLTYWLRPLQSDLLRAADKCFSETAIANGLHGLTVLAASCMALWALIWPHPLSNGCARHQG